MDNVKNVHLYTGSVNGWEFAIDDLLSGDMIDVGEGAAPAFFALQTVNRPDLLIGNAGERITPENGATQTFDGIKAVLNTGTGSTSFSLQENYIFTSLLPGLKELAPEAGDIDGDGDQDLLVGESTGRIYWIERTCPGSNEACFTNRGPLQTNSGDIDVGLNAIPALADINRDNLPDLVIGERNGNLNYYRNVTTRGNISFELVSDSLGKIKIGSGIGYTAPDINDHDEDGKWDLLLGTLSDNLLFYSNIEDNLAGAFAVSPTLIPGEAGLRTVPNSGDINGDNKPEIVVGNFNGGVQLYSRDLLSPVVENRTARLHIYPNPATDDVFIKAEYADPNFTIVDMLGRKMPVVSARGGNFLKFSVNTFPAGVYFIRVLNGNRAIFYALRYCGPLLGKCI